MLNPVIIQLLLILLKIVCLLVAIAYYTIAERKIMAAIQRRRGPNVVGFGGLLQPLADGLKLIAKEMVIPSHSNSRIFVIAPLAILTLGLLNGSILPFGCFDYSEYSSTNEIVKTLYTNNATTASKIGTNNNFELLTEANYISDVRYGVLVILALSSLTVYGLIIAGGASNSKYAFLGALRSAAQMISYEVSISLVLIPVIFMSGSLNFTEIVFAQGQTIGFVLPLFPVSIIFFISMIAETNRTPFDLPEAEAELVAGYNVEYSSIIFAMFFLAEYSNMIMMSLINSELFFGGGYGLPFVPLSTAVTLKALIFCFLFVLVRATFPRYRYDQLMDIGGKVFLPVATGFLLFVIGFIFVLDATPVISTLSSFSTDGDGDLPFTAMGGLRAKGHSFITSPSVRRFIEYLRKKGVIAFCEKYIIDPYGAFHTGRTISPTERGRTIKKGVKHGIVIVIYTALAVYGMHNNLYDNVYGKFNIGVGPYYLPDEWVGIFLAAITVGAFSPIVFLVLILLGVFTGVKYEPGKAPQMTFEQAVSGMFSKPSPLYVATGGIAMCLFLTITGKTTPGVFVPYSKELLQEYAFNVVGIKLKPACSNYECALQTVKDHVEFATGYHNKTTNERMEQYIPALTDTLLNDGVRAYNYKFKEHFFDELPESVVERAARKAAQEAASKRFCANRVRKAKKHMQPLTRKKIRAYYLKYRRITRKDIIATKAKFINKSLKSRRYKGG